ncbi:DNA polymerase III subunit gamma/tau [Campylobacter sp. 2018MI27]|uniref:DNA polymerase III subunit gamma/tau n=2 Tax=Campylobacter TaxID=194 RepID=UPI001BDB19F1|nr:DNA polymerase III subunit gamma/tau [Campylobacter sp. 2018MI27]
MNNMQNLSLKYRPKNYDDLVGQSAVSKSLKYALDSKNIANAYLFSGLRGSGKTSSARILAKALNCERGISSKPCGMCASCVSNDGIDIYELDAASNRGIDSIQDLIENTKYAPLHSRFKIFIIDEVHMLTREAFNALLKTLEEPPSHVKFILATTDVHKLPATILSRVLHFRFKKIPLQDIVSRMEFILANEQIPYEKEALTLIARSGGGSLRDSLTLLEQGIIYSQRKLNKESIALMLGLIEPNIIKQFFADVLSSNDNGIFRFLELAKSYEASVVIDEMSSFLKDSFANKNTNFSLILYDRFFHILAKAKNMTKISDDDEFILYILAFMLKDATKLKSIDEDLKVENINKNEQDYLNFVTMIAKRDYKLGEIFKECASFVSFDGSEFCIKINPKNEEDKQYFKQYYTSVVKNVFASIFNDAKLVLISDLTKQNVKNEVIKEESNYPKINNTNFENNSSKNLKQEFQNNYNTYEEEIKYPEYQSDDFLDSNMAFEDEDNIYEIPDDILEQYEPELQNILFESLVKIKIENDTLELHVMPPYNEKEKAILRDNIKNVLAKCSAFFKTKNAKIINAELDKKKLH